MFSSEIAISGPEPNSTQLSCLRIRQLFQAVECFSNNNSGSDRTLAAPVAPFDPIDRVLKALQESSATVTVHTRATRIVSDRDLRLTFRSTSK
jgi:hypothetical protein